MASFWNMVWMMGIAAVAVLAAICLVGVCVRLHLLVRQASAKQNELRAINKDMEATLKAKSEFLVAKSQEIRTPMNALVSFSDILTQRSLQNCSAEIKEETEGILDIIKKSSQDVLAIFNDVVDYIKIDANLLEIKSVPMSIKQVIHDVCHAEKPNVIPKHLDLSIKYNGEVPQTILGDPVRIRQILSILITNAIKFTKRGTITVSCEVLAGDDPGSSSDGIADGVVDSEKEKETGKHPNAFSATLKQLKISVIDTGIGIAPEHIHELFKPFKHTDSASLRLKDGSGQGLNIAMRLATLMDGTINVESTPGHGSTFSLLLNVYVPEDTKRVLKGIGNEEDVPVEKSQQHDGLEIRVPKKSEPAVADGSQPLKNIRILVVEDVAVNQIIMSTLLRDAGAKVELADNGAAGVQKIMKDMDNGFVFDVVLMDMQMPVMDGYEATTYLRTHDYTRPIIAVTAHALPGDMEKTIKAGCNDYIAKPIDNRRLIKMIKKYAGG